MSVIRDSHWYIHSFLLLLLFPCLWHISLDFNWKYSPFNRIGNTNFKICVFREEAFQIGLTILILHLLVSSAQLFLNQAWKPKLHLLLHPLIYAVHIHIVLVGGWELYKSKVLLTIRSLTAVPLLALYSRHSSWFEFCLILSSI